MQFCSSNEYVYTACQRLNQPASVTIIAALSAVATDIILHSAMNVNLSLNFSSVLGLLNVGSKTSCGVHKHDQTATDTAADANAGLKDTDGSTERQQLQSRSIFAEMDA